MKLCVVIIFLFFEQKTAYEMRISDWSSDVCSSDLGGALPEVRPAAAPLPSRTPGDHLFHVPVVGSQLDVPTDAGDERALRSDERRVGKECVSTRRARRAP